MYAIIIYVQNTLIYLILLIQQTAYGYINYCNNGEVKLTQIKIIFKSFLPPLRLWTASTQGCRQVKFYKRQRIRSKEITKILSLAKMQKTIFWLILLKFFYMHILAETINCPICNYLFLFWPQIKKSVLFPSVVFFFLWEFGGGYRERLFPKPIQSLSVPYTQAKIRKHQKSHMQSNYKIQLKENVTVYLVRSKNLSLSIAFHGIIWVSYVSVLSVTNNWNTQPTAGILLL